MHIKARKESWKLITVNLSWGEGSPYQLCFKRVTDGFLCDRPILQWSRIELNVGQWVFNPYLCLWFQLFLTQGHLIWRRHGVCSMRTFWISGKKCVIWKYVFSTVCTNILLENLTKFSILTQISAVFTESKMLLLRREGNLLSDSWTWISFHGPHLIF